MGSSATSYFAEATISGLLTVLRRTGSDFYLMGCLRRYENAYFQHKIGILKDREWVSISEDINSFFARPGARTSWSLIKSRSSPDFRIHVDAIVERCAAASQAVRPSAQDELEPRLTTNS